MRTILSVASETFCRLRRDRIFLPALMIGAGLLGLSGLASYWSVEEFFKLLYDLGSTAYLFTGAAVAIFWGNKIVSDSRQEGSLEVQLASPIGRSSWLIGKYLGLVYSLVLLALGFIAAWQLVYLSYGMGWMNPHDLLMFGVLTLSWLVLAALSIFFASFASQAVALFCTLWMFICGMISAPIMQALAPDTPESTRKVVETLAGVWNLHLFNIAQSYAKSHIPTSPADLNFRIAYGVILCGLFLAMACFAFQRKDIIA